MNDLEFAISLLGDEKAMCRRAVPVEFSLLRNLFFLLDKKENLDDDVFMSNLEQSLLSFCRQLETKNELKSWAKKIESCFCSGVPWIEIGNLENLLNKMADELYVKEFSETIEIKLLK